MSVPLRSSGRTPAPLHLAEYITSHPEFGTVTFSSMTGDPADEIVKCANSHHADLVVIPCHGLRGIRRMLPGSVAHDFINGAQCEIFVQRYPDIK